MGAWCSSQGETSCTGSLQSPKELCIRHQLRPSSEVAGEALPAAGGGDREASGKGQWVVRGHCLPELIQRILKIYCNALMNWYF